jgi:hypothetical protein
MIRRRIDHLPVIEKERKGPPTLKGILTSNHVLECMLPSERIGRKSIGCCKDVKINLPMFFYLFVFCYVRDLYIQTRSWNLTAVDY